MHERDIMYNETMGMTVVSIFSCRFISRMLLVTNAFRIDKSRFSSAASDKERTVTDFFEYNQTCSTTRRFSSKTHPWPGYAKRDSE
jgi:hypothetical protein